MLTGNIFLAFLSQNLLLAFIPWSIALILYITHIKNKIAVIALLLLWLLFFPNAPYILTDIIHIRKSTPRYVWFDFILVLAYSFTGLFYAYTGINFVERTLHSVFKIRRTYLISAFVLYLSAYGIYLGRFLRWNSWDVVANMTHLLKDIMNHICHPATYSQVWIFSFLMGTMLFGLYWAFRIFSVENNNDMT